MAETKKYKCKVCGQIVAVEEGESCPICGAAYENLVPYDEDEDFGYPY